MHLPSNLFSRATCLALALGWAGVGYGQLGAEDPNFTQKNHAIVTGAHAHSFGLGFDLHYRRKYADRVDLLFEWALSSFRDPSETRVPSLYSSQGGRDYVLDKQNQVYFLGMTAGAQYTLIQRTEFSRVQVSGGLGVGPIWAIRKPYLLEVIRGNTLVVEPYQGPEVQSFESIFGQGEFLRRFDLISTQWGARVRGNLTVDLSGTSFFVRALHLGFQGDFFSSPVPILFSGANRSSFWGVYAGFVVGTAWE